MAETVGSLCDKISIMELKIFHMREHSERVDASAEFRDRCLARLKVLEGQRDALSAEVTALIAGIGAGRLAPAIYRQFKMYNDPQYRRDEG